MEEKKSGQQKLSLDSPIENLLEKCGLQDCKEILSSAGYKRVWLFYSSRWFAFAVEIFSGLAVA